MRDLLKLTKDYHDQIRIRLKASVLSPEQLKIHERILELARDASDTNDLEGKKSAENLTFAMSRAISMDNWTVKAKAAKEAEDAVAARVFTDIAEAAGKTQDSSSLASTVDTSSTKGMELLRNQEDTRNAFIEAVYVIFDYRAVHPANIEKKKKLAENLRIHTSRIEANGKKFDELVNVSTYRKSLPLTDAQWQIVIKTYNDMRSPSVDPDAKAKLDTQVKQGREALGGKSAQMKEISKYLEEKGTRLAYLGISPSQEPGPYTFEKIWEGGRDE